MADELDALLSRIDDDSLRSEITARISRLRKQRKFGLVFEDHLPETVVLPQHGIRRGTKVVPIGNPSAEPEMVTKVAGGKATLLSEDGPHQVQLDEVTAVAEFGVPIYPGLKRLGSVERGGAKPSHLVIKGENYHALEALQFTHAGKVDCIYIDPPYNTGNSDWVYNNNYVDGNDLYRHSKWLAFMQRRLTLAKRLLKESDSVLIVAIDENEENTLGLLLRQMFPGSRLQKVTTVTNPRGKQRDGQFSRTEETLYFVPVGAAAVQGEPDPDYGGGTAVPWRTFRRSDIDSKRGTSKGGDQFYPVYVSTGDCTIQQIGDPLPDGVPREQAPEVEGCVAVFPIRQEGQEMNWGLTAQSAKALLAEGFLRVRPEPKESHPQPFQISYLTEGKADDVRSGRATVVGQNPDGSVNAVYVENKLRMPKSVWTIDSHNAEVHGTNVVKDLLGEKLFDFPKSLYAVADAINHFVSNKPDAVVLDFFSGSGTTAHAVALLNERDGGQRQSISVTNNEMSDAEQAALKTSGVNPGDPEWESSGVFERVTRRRLEAAVTGVRPDGNPVEGAYKSYSPSPNRHCKKCNNEECTGVPAPSELSDVQPMSDGLHENFEFLELEYLDPTVVELDRAFDAVAPLLWMRAGAVGPILAEAFDSSGARKPYAVSHRYAVLFNPARFRSFLEDLPESATHAFVVTDSLAEFTSISGKIPSAIEAVQLYENYLTTFAINTGRIG